MSLSLSSLSQIALWVLMSLLYVAVFLLYRHVGGQMKEERRATEQGPELDKPVELTMTSIPGKPYRIGGDSDRNAILFFGAPHCGYCERAKPILTEFVAKNEDVNLFIVYQGDEEATRKYVETLPSSVIAVPDPKGDVFLALNVKRTPYGIVTGRKGIVMQKSTASTQEAIEFLYKTAASRPAHVKSAARA